jgi:glycosyltransferase involved in cell wall biosynthesis
MISVVIHTHNEEKNIEECIHSAQQLTQDILLIDMESTDRTREIAEQNKVKIFTFPFQHYVEPARVFGIKQAHTDWVLILDADERITKELSEEIKNSIKNTDFTHYKIPRKNIFGKKQWLKYGGWFPDYQIHLINKHYFHNWPKQIHSTPSFEGKMGYLNNPIIHYFHGNLEEMVQKTIIFEDIESDLLFQAQKNASTCTFFRKFFGELTRRFLLKTGFRDGLIGIIESIYQAFSKTITYLYLYEKKKSRSLRSVS